MRLARPTRCLAFSPNWYLPQILYAHPKSHQIAYGSNNDIFIINYEKKCFIQHIFTGDDKSRESWRTTAVYMSEDWLL